jgi:enolase-phosphatase E1
MNQIIKAIVTDIEGTTSSIDFVHRVLFPYSTKALPEYLKQHQNQPEIAAIIYEVCQQIQQPQADLDRVIETLLAWIKADKKITPLKTLQGFIWEDGFINNHFKGHLYEDADRYLQQWHQAGIKLYVFSSGSVKAQKLLFGHSEYGDLTYLFSGYFDTEIGNKKQADAYQNIAGAIALPPQEILFLSDVIAELDAASSVGYHTILLDRDNQHRELTNYQVVSSFDEIAFSS